MQYSQDVTGLDASPLFLQLAKKNVLSANYVEAFAESMPFPDCLFETSAQLCCDARNVIGEIATNLSGSIPRHQARWSIHFGTFSSHKSVFLGRVGCIFVVVWTETDLGSLLAEVGWRSYNSEEERQPKLYTGGNIQVIQVQKSYQIR